MSNKKQISNQDEGSDSEGRLESTTTKTSSRKSTENEVFRSDRIELVEQANQFVESMVAKTTLPKIGSGFDCDITLLGEEADAYKAALEFLKRQFEMGYSDSEVVPKKAEIETTSERELAGHPV